MRTLSDKKNNAIDLVCGLINTHQNKTNCNTMQQLARLYYAESIPAELVQFDTNNLYGAIVSLWDGVKQRQANEVKIRVYNPNYDEHQWHTSHTTVDII